jgi:hypothetical protein
MTLSELPDTTWQITTPGGTDGGQVNTAYLQGWLDPGEYVSETRVNTDGVEYLVIASLDGYFFQQVINSASE